MRFDETLMNCVLKDLKAGNIVMLLGEPGIGKSSWTENLANLMNTQCFTLACNQLADKADLTGARLMPYTDPQGNESYKQCFFPHAVIMDAVDYAEEHPRETPVLFLDEINRTNADVTSELLSIPTLRSIGNVRLPENLIVMCAGNDKGNVISLDEASISRFVLYKVHPDTATFLSLDDEINPFVKTVLERHPETIFCKKLADMSTNDNDDDGNALVSIDDIIGADDGMAQITTPRTIAKLSAWLNLHTNEELLALLADTYEIDGEPTSALQEQVEGHVGHTLFSTFLLAEISANLSTTSNQSTTLQVLKPDCFSLLEAATDIDQLNNVITNDLDGKQRSNSLLYALYDKNDHAVIVRQLAQQITDMTSDDLKTLIKLSAHGKLDDENTQALLSCSCALVDKIGIVLEMGD